MKKCHQFPSKRLASVQRRASMPFCDSVTTNSPESPSPTDQSMPTYDATRSKPSRHSLVHLADEGVDVLLAVAQVTTLDEVLELAGAEATVGVAELEGPQEVGGLLEVGADGVDLVDEVLHADDAELAEVLLDDGVVSERSALLVDLAVSALVDKLLDGLEVGVAVGDPGLDDLDHLGGGLGDLDEDAVVDLEEAQQLEDLARLGRHLVDTLDADQEDQLGLGGDVEGALLLGDARQADLLALLLAVLLDVLLSTLEDGGALLLVGLKGNVSLDSTKLTLPTSDAVALESDPKDGIS